MNDPLKKGDKLIHMGGIGGMSKAGDRRKFVVVGTTINLYICRSIKGEYLECFRKDDWKHGRGLRQCND